MSDSQEVIDKIKITIHRHNSENKTNEQTYYENHFQINQSTLISDRRLEQTKRELEQVNDNDR